MRVELVQFDRLNESCARIVWKILVRANTSLITYEKVCPYIYEQVEIWRDLKNIQKGPVSMEINMVENMMSNLIDEKDEKNEDECIECDTENPGGWLKQLFSYMMDILVASLARPQKCWMGSALASMR